MPLHYADTDRKVCQGCPEQKCLMKRILGPGVYGSRDYFCLNVGKCIFATDPEKLTTWARADEKQNEEETYVEDEIN